MSLFGSLSSFFNRNTTTITQIHEDVQKAKADLQDLQGAVQELQNQAAEELPVSESVATVLGAHKLEQMCKKAGLTVKAEEYKKMREELLNTFEIRNQVQNEDAERQIGQITTKLNTFIRTIEHDEASVDEEKYNEMFCDICWDIEHLRYILSFENHEKCRTILKEIIENKKMLHVGCAEWLKQIDVDNLLGVKK